MKMPLNLRAFILSVAAVASAPALARTLRDPTARSAQSITHRDVLPTLLRARIASINARIDMLREQGAIGSEEAQELRRQARRLQGQTYGLSRRDEGDVEFGISRLDSRLGFAMDDSRVSGHIYDRDFNDLHPDREQRDRYAMDRSGDYQNFDRYTGSSVDRWHDPFDRGNEN